MSEDRLLTVRDLIDQLKVSRSTVMSLLAAGAIESLIVGRRARRIRPTALAAYVERCAAAEAARRSRAGSDSRPETAE